MKILEIIKKNNIIILFFLTLICMTVGFAVYNQKLNMGGNISLVPGGVIEITEVKTVSISNAEANPQRINNNTGIDFNLSFTTVNQENPTYQAVFDITISNQTFNDFVFNMPEYKPKVGIVTDNGVEYNEEYSAYIGWKISNASIGDKIPAKTEKTFTITFTFTNPQENYGKTYEIDGEFIPNVGKDDEATIMGSVADSGVADLTGTNEKALCTLKVINTYSADQTFTIATKNTDKFVVQNESNNYTISANSEANFEFYIAKVEGTEYPYNSTYVDIIIESQGVTYNTGSIKVLVDQNIVVEDTTAPTIRNVSATIGDTENTAQLTWEAEDDVTIEFFTIYIYQYDENTSVFEKLEKEITVEGSEKSVLITDLAEGDYYFTIFGTDNSQNTATSEEIANATVSEGTASRSEEIELDWNFDVTINATNNITYTGETGSNIVKRGDIYTATLTATSTDYKIPESLDSLTMGGEDYTNYTYENGVITIPNVTGDIVINATGIWNFTICLVEGTQILLADGTYKNIEDIEYTDLLTVYDHLNGGITQVYPVWIEKTGVTSTYEKITFDDGTYINVAGRHCLFDSEQNKYVDVSNPQEFDIGSRVYKIENGKLKTVTAVNIEYINEEVKYYDVLSTTHYNVIANDLITTDIITQFANILYGFKENAVFANFEKLLNSEQIEYKDAKYMPYNWFKGCNLNNTLYLVKKGYVDLKDLGGFLIDRGKKQITKQGEIHFIVTTSNDEINSVNVDEYLYKEGSTYTFPKIGAKYFIDTSTNKKYKEGDTFTVYNSTHFKIEY